MDTPKNKSPEKIVIRKKWKTKSFHWLQNLELDLPKRGNLILFYLPQGKTTKTKIPTSIFMGKIEKLFSCFQWNWKIFRYISKQSCVCAENHMKKENIWVWFFTFKQWYMRKIEIKNHVDFWKTMESCMSWVLKWNMDGGFLDVQVFL